MNLKISQTEKQILINKNIASSIKVETNDYAVFIFSKTKKIVVSINVIDTEDYDLLFPQWLSELNGVIENGSSSITIEKFEDKTQTSEVTINILEDLEGLNDFEGFDIDAARKQVKNIAAFGNNQFFYLNINNKKVKASITNFDNHDCFQLSKSTRIRFIGNGIPAISDVGGQTQLIDWYNNDYLFSLKAKSLLLKWKIKTPRGLLLSGKPGLGKTHFMKALIADAGVYYINVSAPDIITPLAGDGDKILEERFIEARKNSPSIICIDEVDSLCLNRSSSNQNYENRVVTVLLKEMDGLETRGDVLVIGTTNRPEAIDSAFKRPGRFTYQIELKEPNKEDRKQILKIHLKSINYKFSDKDFDLLSNLTDGFTGAEIASSIQKAGIQEIRKHLESSNSELTLKLDTLIVVINTK